MNWLGKSAGDTTIDELAIDQWSPTTFWLEFENTGGRTWDTETLTMGDASLVQWKVFLGSSAANGGSHRDSVSEASDWIDYLSEDDWRVTVADDSLVAPGETVRFTFGLYGSGSLYSRRTETFNLYAATLRWFKLQDPNGNDLDSVAIPIYIWDDCAPNCPPP